ncbi:unnamed protein product [Echinostoma caproni]|uniref:Ig-like domain-containing protein n=1 Tax=Echinostoma caproni TaxID=27848 RepID=A0A183AF65_9TREM|nr:unnamed protein product [Echinostoma caproni]
MGRLIQYADLYEFKSTTDSSNDNLEITCVLVLHETVIYKDLEPVVELSMFNQTKHLILSHPVSPQLFRQSIKSNREQIATNLNQCEYPTDPEWFRNSANYPRMEDGVIELVFKADIGFPSGWILIWSMFEVDDQVIPDPCLLSNETVETDSKRLIRASCMIQPRHVALFIATVHSLGSVVDKTQINTRLAHIVSNNISAWTKRINPVTPQSEIDMCYVFDYCLVKLRFGWHAFVYVGDPILMQGRLGRHNLSDVRCFFRTNRDSIPMPLSERFIYQDEPMFDRFLLRTNTSLLTDSGWYECEIRNYRGNSPSVGMHSRLLLVLPKNDSIGCSMTVLRKNGRFPLNRQIIENNTFYLLSNQIALVHCRYARVLDLYYNITRRLHYRMYNDHKERWQDDFPDKFVEPISDIDDEPTETTNTIMYRIRAIRSRYYTGMLDVACESIIQVTAPAWVLKPPVNRLILRCNQSFTIQEPANGELEFRILSHPITTKPIALGSQIECAGGYGRPGLTYTWTRIRSVPYWKENEENTEVKPDIDVDLLNDIPSLLPADLPGTGWGDPLKPLADTPSGEPKAVDHLLYVPSDPDYRGMNYLYLCTGENVVENKTYTIRRYFHLSILICSNRRISLDLSLVLSHNLFSACELSTSASDQIHFYGYYFLTMIRQLIFGLPRGAKNARVGILIFDQPEMDFYRNYTIIPFDSNLDRIALARRLYSRSQKPITDRRKCNEYSYSLNRLLPPLKRMHSTGNNRLQVTVLPVDELTNVSLSHSGFQAIRMLQNLDVQFLLTMIRPNGSLFTKPMNDLLELLKPDHVITLTPLLPTVTDCDSCKLGASDARLRISRLPFFDAICQVGGSPMPEPVGPPQFQFPVPEHFWVQQYSLGIGCIMRPTRTFTKWETTVEFVMCLLNSNQTNLMSGSQKHPSLQNISDSCSNRLGLSAQPVLPNGNNDSYGITAIYPNKKYPVSIFVLCYYRVGEAEPEVYDPVHYRTAHVRLRKPTVNKPILFLKTHGPGGAIQFLCIYEGYANDLEVVLVFKYPLIKSNTKVMIYQIVTRSWPNAQPQSKLCEAKLTWVDVISLSKDQALYCLVRPRSDDNYLRRLNELPKEEDLTKYSAPLSGLSFSSPLDSLREGSRVQFDCVFPSSSHGLPLKMVYSNQQNAVVLCNVVKPLELQTFIESANETEHACQFASPLDTDCTRFVRAPETNNTFYESQCLVRRERASAQIYRTIRFSVNSLQIVDFNALVYCQGIVTLFPHTPKSVSKKSFFSEIIQLPFPIGPKISQFVYDPREEIWKCHAVLYPPNKDGEIRIIQTDNHRLGDYLKKYKSTITFISTRPKIINVHKPMITPKPVDYAVSIRFEPKLSHKSSIPHGQVLLRCSVAGKSKELETDTKDTTSGEIIEPHINHVGDTIFYECKLSFSRDLSPKRVHLHRIARTSWLQYDRTLVFVNLEEKSIKQSISGPTEKENLRSLKVIPLDLISSTENFEYSCTVDSGPDYMLVRFNVGPNTEFDSGEYYCSVGTSNQIYLYSELQFSVFQGETRTISLAQRSAEHSSLWFQPLRAIYVGDLVHTRCIAWTTNPSDRAVSVFQLIPVKPPTGINRTVLVPTHKSGIIIRMMDQYERVGRSLPHTDFGCLLISQQSVEQKVYKVPPVVCKAPTKLYWEPDNLDVYTTNHRLKCNSRDGCHNGVVRWEWTAGPIPRISMPTDDWNPKKIVEGEILELSRLARAGHYIFRCSVICPCHPHPLGGSIVVSFFLQPDKEDYRLRELHKPDNLLKDTETDEHLDIDFRPPLSKSHPEVEDDSDYVLLTTLRLKSQKQTKFDQCVPDDAWGETFVCYPPQMPPKETPVIPDTELPRKKVMVKISRKIGDDQVEFIPVPDGLRGESELTSSALLSARNDTRWLDKIYEEVDQFSDGKFTRDDKMIPKKMSQRIFDFRWKMWRDREKIMGKYRAEWAKRPIKKSFLDMRDLPDRFQPPIDKFVIPPRRKSSSKAYLRRRPKKRWFRPVKPNEFASDFETVEQHKIAIPDNGTGIYDYYDPVEWDHSRWTKRPWMSKQIKDQLNYWQELESHILSTETDKFRSHESSRTIRGHSSNALRLSSSRESVPTAGGKFGAPRGLDSSTTGDIRQSYSGREDLRSHDTYSTSNTWDRWKRFSIEDIHPDLAENGYEIKSLKHAWPSKMSEFFQGIQWNRWIDFLSRRRNKSPPDSVDFDRIPSHIDQHNLDSVTLTRTILMLPGVVTIRCPFLEYWSEYAYQPVTLYWSRVTTLADFHQNNVKPILSVSFLERQLEMSEDNQDEESRFFIYPPLRWSQMQTLDIKPVFVGDYGYYICTTTVAGYFRDSMAHNITKVAPYPLCLVPKLNKPVIRIIRSKTYLSTITDESNEAQLNVTMDSNVCVEPGEEIILLCQSMAYQMFCEGPDEYYHGYRLVRTHLVARLFGLETGLYEVLDNNFPVHMLGLGAWQITSTGERSLNQAWSLNVTEKHDRATVYCHAEPTLIRPFAPPIPHWSWLLAEFKQLKSQGAFRKLSHSRLCVNSRRSDLRLEVEHERSPLSLDVDQEVISIRPGQAIYCHSRPLTSLTPELHVFAIRAERLDAAKLRGLSNADAWIDFLRILGHWHIDSLKRKARLVVPGDVENGEFYFILCSASEAQKNESIIIRIHVTERTFLGRLDIQRTVCVTAIVATLLFYMCLRWYLVYLRRLRTTHPRRRNIATVEKGFPSISYKNVKDP